MRTLSARLLARAVLAEAGVVAGALRAQGARRFGRALGVGAALILVAYLGVYAPARRKSARVNSEIERAKALAEHGRQYKELSGRLQEAYGRLPPAEQREQWLSDAVRASLDAQGLVTEDFKPVRTQEESGLIFQSSTVSLKLRFAELFAWIQRLEASGVLMHVQSLELEKKPDSVGLAAAACEIVTIVPKQRFQ
ncbi:MAG: type II secretion system protein M [Elusimicrobia bacterium]|nr:type II secretion system protein M [Elusimicrobiota bacterium]